MLSTCQAYSLLIAYGIPPRWWGGGV